MSVSSVNSNTTTSSRMRLTGLGGSGLDTDTIITQLMKTERIPLDKLLQKKQSAEWKQDSYREITNLLRGLKDDYFNVAKPTNNMLSANTYKKYTYTTSDSSVVSVTGNSDATAGNHTIKINDIAVAAMNSSSSGVTAQIAASSDVDVESVKGKSFTMVIDGVQKQIEISDSISSETELITDLQKSIDSAFGSNKIKVGDTNSDGTGKLTFSTVSQSGVSKLTIYSGSSDSSDAMSGLGFSSQASNRIITGDSLKNIASSMSTPFTFNSDGKLVLEINGKEFKFDKETTLKSMMSEINNDSTANVIMKYDEVNDKFTFTAKQTGLGNNLAISETGSTFLKSINMTTASGSSTSASAFKDYSGSGNSKSFSVMIDGIAKDITLDGDYSTFTSSDFTTMLKNKIEDAFDGAVVNVSSASGVLSISSGSSTVSVGEPISGTSALTDLGFTASHTAGKDATVILDGHTITRSNNSFTVNGVTYNLLKKSTTEQTVSLTQDVNGVYDNIKNFVDKYNTVIDTINDKLDEKYDRNYQPLTQEQKDAMSDDQITKWETKAKTGLLRNDTILQDIAYDMRRALSDSITGVSSSLSSIGITTGSYDEKGKLYIDEDKLKTAIQNNPDAVNDLFTKKSTITSNIDLSQSERTQRYNEEGLANRLSDIIDNNIRTNRDSDDKKGILLEKAGMVGDLSEVKNSIYEEIDDYDDKIYDLQQKLIDKEDAYYTKYANLEKMLSQMQTQASSLLSQLSSSSS
jgi:Flagellar capping protein